jgi:RNA polymerase sigma-70 factor (ECF subfamily)
MSDTTVGFYAITVNEKIGLKIIAIQRTAQMNPTYLPQPNTEEMLVSEATKGSLEAFNQLVLRYQNLAYQHAYALTGETASAQDIIQESFIKSFRNIRNFRGGSFRAWLLKIITNTTYDVFRQSRQVSIQPLFPENEYGEEIESPGWLTHPAASVEAAVERHEDSKRVNQLLGELPEAYRQVLILVDMYELDYWEAAELLNLPLGTVKSRLARGRLQMKKKLWGDNGYLYSYNPSLSATPL